MPDSEDHGPADGLSRGLRPGMHFEHDLDAIDLLGGGGRMGPTHVSGDSRSSVISIIVLRKPSWVKTCWAAPLCDLLHRTTCVMPRERIHSIAARMRSRPMPW